MENKKLFQYNKEYWNLMSKLNIRTGKIINEVRWKFVKEFKPKVVLDFGAGLNLLKKYAPKRITVDSFDIGNFPIKYTGIRHKKYDLVFFCDVLEHVPDFQVLDSVFEKTKYVYVSVPILPKEKRLEGWNHFKYDTKEHLHYFTKESLDLFFEARGFKLVKSGCPEVDCGIRTDIYSAIYKKESIVFTNGVFDLIHVGHIHLLKEAKKLGDKLIVGINSDNSAEKIKRKPIQNEKERKEILKSIKMVNNVEIFDELNPLKLIKKIKPDIIVKGGDYTKKTVIGCDFIKSLGGNVTIIPLLKGSSTTNIMNKIKGRSFKKDLSKRKGGYL
jgi:D-glycero-beta-D-manno-heptose 1-phosphate adenylyltransferase